MKKPYTISLVALDVSKRVAYAGERPTFWTWRGAKKKASELNLISRAKNVIWLPTVAKKDQPW